MLVIFAIFLGLACYPTPIKAFVKVREDAQPGYYIFNHTEDGNACNITGPTMKKTYFIFNDTFLYVNETPDLDEDEALCSRKTFALEYSCKTTDDNPKFNVFITIVAVDEFDPEFDPRKFSVVVKEEEPKGTEVQFENGTYIDFKNYISDKDCDDNQFKFQLHDDGRGIFSISGSSIVTNEVIDYETDDHVYDLTLFAENDPDDSTQATKNASSIISIFIKDIDDMNPFFKHPSYTLHVMEENSSFVNVELTVTPHELAYDQDLGINQTLKYVLSDTVENFTNINGDTGAISLSKQLDREYKASYTFQIKAVQNNSEQRFAVSQLNLIVDDINDNHAVFDMTTLQITIPENLATGSFVNVVQALDADEGINANFSYVISDGALDVDPATGIISVLNSSALDRETNDKLTFQISTKPLTEVHSNKPCPNCKVTLYVELSDVNDNNPEFEFPYYDFFVEDNVPGKLVGKVLATDKDIDENALVRYSIESQQTDFSINSMSGEITLASQTTLPTTIIVKACDSPNIILLRRCSSVQVDFQSKDNSSIQGFDIDAAVFENLPSQSIVADVPFYSKQFKFDLQPNDEFELIENLIKTKVELDREEKQNYSLQLNVSNGSQTQKSYFVTITVNDSNDNAPNFDQDDYFFLLTEDIKIGSLIGNVTATDKDEGMNAYIKYYIEGQNSKYFNISTSGGISLLMMPDIALTQTFLSLVVRAADSGQPSLQNFTDVKIQVGHSNGTVRIPVGEEKHTIIANQQYYEGSLLEILGVKIVIRNTSTYGAGSVIHISGLNKTDDSEIPLNDLNSLVQKHMEAIQTLFMRKQQSVPPTHDNGMSSEAVALIAVACVLFVGSILLTAVTYYKFKRYQRLQRLVHNLSRKNSIYETQETSIAIEDEVSEYEQQDSTSTQNLIIDDKTSSDVPNGQVAGVDNPGYDADGLLAREAPNSSQNTEPTSDYVNAELVEPTTSLDTLDNIQEQKLEKDCNESDFVKVESDTDDVDHESTEDSVKNDLVNNHNSTEDPVNDDLLHHEELTKMVDADTPLKDTDQSERVFVPIPPPLPDILPSLSKSSSSSELKDTSPKIPTDSSKSPHYQNVLLELSAAVKKRSDGEETVEDEPVVDPEPKCVPTVDKESLEVIDLDEAGPEDLNTSSNLSDIEEPEPDYAKRVRFNENDVKDEIIPPTIKKAEDSDDEQPNLGHDLRNTEEIKSPNDSLNGETGTFVFGQVEITEF